MGIDGSIGDDVVMNIADEVLFSWGLYFGGKNRWKMVSSYLYIVVNVVREVDGKLR